MTIVPLVVGYFAIQWNRATFLGKSPEQIVAMGRSKWTEIYGKKFGDSTQQMCAAIEKYGIALQNLDDRAMARLPRTRQVWLQEVRETTKEYAIEAHKIGEIVTGGGTIWQTFNVTILPDVEQVIADCIVDKPLANFNPKSLESQLQQLDKVIGNSKLYADSDSIGYRELVKHRTALSTKQNKLLGLLSKARLSDSTRVQIYMHRKIDVAKGDGLTQ
jgi:hypothetical protein